MFQGRRQSDMAKARMVQKHSMAQAQRSLLDFTERIREEVYTFVFSDIDQFFGLQPDEVMIAIDEGLRKSLKAEDIKWKTAIAKRYDGAIVITHMDRLLRGEISAEDSVFIRVIRDELIDIVAQYVTDFLKKDKTLMQNWVNSLVVRPSLQPHKLVEDARVRKEADDERKRNRRKSA